MVSMATHFFPIITGSPPSPTCTESSVALHRPRQTFVPIVFANFSKIPRRRSRKIARRACAAVCRGKVREMDFLRRVVGRGFVNFAICGRFLCVDLTCASSKMAASDVTMKCEGERGTFSVILRFGKCNNFHFYSVL